MKFLSCPIRSDLPNSIRGMRCQELNDGISPARRAVWRGAVRCGAVRCGAGLSQHEDSNGDSPERQPDEHAEDDPLGWRQIIDRFGVRVVFHTGFPSEGALADVAGAILLRD
jgi:hypothetical protein